MTSKPAFDVSTLSRPDDPRIAWCCKRNGRPGTPTSSCCYGKQARLYGVCWRGETVFAAPGLFENSRALYGKRPGLRLLRNEQSEVPIDGEAGSPQSSLEKRVLSVKVGSSHKWCSLPRSILVKAALDRESQRRQNAAVKLSTWTGLSLAWPADKLSRST